MQLQSMIAFRPLKVFAEQHFINTLPAFHTANPPNCGLFRALHPSYRNRPTNVLFESTRTLSIISRARHDGENKAKNNDLREQST